MPSARAQNSGLSEGTTRNSRYLQNLQIIGAIEGTRTPTPLPVHGPEPCASANSATMASGLQSPRQPQAAGSEKTCTFILQTLSHLSNLRASLIGHSLQQQHSNGIARLFADCLPNVCPHRQFMPAVAQRHERTLERMTVNRATDLDQPASSEKTDRLRPDDESPTALRSAFLQLGFERLVQQFSRPQAAIPASRSS